MRNKNKHQNLNVCVRWLLVIMIVDRTSEREQRQGISLSRAVSKIMKSRYVLKHVELKLYTTTIKSVVVYCCETWTMTGLMKLSLETWEWKLERYRAQCKFRMAGKSELTRNCRLCMENQIPTIKVR
jgi:hypothetical protein